MNYTTMTREQAIDALVEMDVAKWGEAERDASRKMHADRTRGLALNELANRHELADKPIPELRKAAKEALTRADHAYLRG